MTSLNPQQKKISLLWAVIVLSVSASTHTKAASDADCDCTVYLYGNRVSGEVINNATGWVEPFEGIGYHSRNLDFTIQPRSGSRALLDRQAIRSCSTEQVRCIDVRQLRMVFAIPNNRTVGLEYSSGGYKFKIIAIGREARDGSMGIYWINVLSASDSKLSDFVYSDRSGVVSINMGYSPNDTFKSLYLASGPGLLSR